MEVAPLGEWLEQAPWRTAAVTLLWIGDEGDLHQAWTLTDKRQLLGWPGGIMYAAWTGRFHTEVRYLDDGQRAAVAELLTMKPNRREQ